MGKSSRLHKKVVEGTLTAKDAIDQALAHGIAAGKQAERERIIKIVKDEQEEYRPTAYITCESILTRIERTET